jgi:hypothetical protein
MQWNPLRVTAQEKKCFLFPHFHIGRGVRDCLGLLHRMLLLLRFAAISVYRRRR